MASARNKMEKKCWGQYRENLHAMDFEQNFTRNWEPLWLCEQGRDTLLTVLEGWSANYY